MSRLLRLVALPVPPGGVHGSAHVASADQIKGALGGAAGLIVGRENRKGGQLLRYAGQAHLTIAPTRSVLSDRFTATFGHRFSLPENTASLRRPYDGSAGLDGAEKGPNLPKNSLSAD